jgi:hypothetical protein
MAVRFTYDDIKAKVLKNKPLAVEPVSSVDVAQPNTNTQEAINAQTTQTTPNIVPLEPISLPMEDVNYQSTFTSAQQDITKILSITQDSVGFTNTFSNAPQILINSDRVIINTKRDYLMLFGAAGVAISSQNPVNLDSDSSITIAATEGVYLGVPNNGKPYDFDNQKKPKTKGEPTTNQPYEPVALGIKLANLLEDLLVVIKNARIITPMGLAYLREDAQYDLANLQARIPEILSNTVFVDGVSHETTDPAPKQPQTATETDTTVPAAINQTPTTPQNTPSAETIQQVSGDTTTTAIPDISTSPDYYTPGGTLGNLAK